MNTSGSNANAKAKAEEAIKQAKEILAMPTKSLEVIAQAQPPPKVGNNSKNVQKGGGSKSLLYGFLKTLLWPISLFINTLPMIYKQFLRIPLRLMLSLIVLVLELIALDIIIQSASKAYSSGMLQGHNFTANNLRAGRNWLMSSAKDFAVTRGGGPNGNNAKSIDEFKSEVSQLENTFGDFSEEEIKVLIERLLEVIKKMIPSGVMTAESIYNALLKRLDAWYYSNTKPQTGMFKTRNNSMRALNKTPLLRAAMGLGPMPYRLGGKQNQKTRKQRK